MKLSDVLYLLLLVVCIAGTVYIAHVGLRDIPRDCQKMIEYHEVPLPRYCLKYLP